MRKNFGCTHFIVERDHAGIGDYYGPFDTHYIFDDYPDLGIALITFASFFYRNKCGNIANDKVCPHAKSNHRRNVSYVYGTSTIPNREKNEQTS